MEAWKENLFEGMSYLSDPSKAGFDKTIKAEIIKIEDVNTGKYRVAYEGDELIAYANDINYLYQVGDVVYVEIPQNDMSARKCIKTKISSSKSLSEEELARLSAMIQPVGPTWDRFFENWPNEKTGLDVNGTTPTEYIWEIGDASNEFGSYAKIKTAIQISADFLTEFIGTYTGDYGLIFTFTQDGKEQFYTVKFNTNDFFGQPYTFFDGSTQVLTVDLPANVITGLSTIKFYQDLKSTDGEEYDDTLFVDNIRIQWVDKIDLTTTNYYLYLETDKGYNFTKSINEIELTANLLYLGTKISDSTNTKYYWYQEKYSSTNNLAGNGWELLNSSVENTYIVNKTAVPTSKVFKVIAVYNDETVVENIITLTNDTSQYNYKINRSGSTLRLKSNDSPEKTYTGKWYYQQSNGSLKLLTDTPTDSLNVKDYLEMPSAVFKCEVYHEDNWIGNDVYTLANSAAAQDLFSLIVEGDTLYHYDASGDITIYDSELQRKFALTINWADEVHPEPQITFMVNGELITKESSINPNNSMMMNCIQDMNNSLTLRYNIKQKYINNTQNRITVIIKADDVDYTYYYNIIFLKDGDQGTNGTTYTAIIRPTNQFGTISTERFIPLSNNAHYYKCFVYCNGEEITNNASYSISYDWSFVGCQKTDASSESAAMVGIKLKAPYNEAKYARCEIVVNDTSLYVNYPFDVVTSVDSQTEVTAIAGDIDMLAAPRYVMYSSSGHSPVYTNESIEIQYKDKIITSVEIPTGYEDLLHTQTRTQHAGIFLRPVEHYDYTGEKVGLLRYEITDDDITYYIYHTVYMYLNTYGNEAINGWDGHSISLDENNHTILAPQIGAGEKNNDNQFTGIVMGKYSGTLDEREQPDGLFGFQEGVNTFALFDDGTGYFGAGEGYLEFNGTDAEINGGGGGKSSIGMTIAMKDSTETGNTKAIQIGNDNFWVNYKGELNAQSATISGKISANEGTIGGWTITETTLQNSRGSISLNSSTGTITGATISGGSIGIGGGEGNPSFSVTNTGVLTATGATINGTINASGGNFNGDIKVIGGSISLGSGITLSNDGNIYLNGGSIIGDKDDDKYWNFSKEAIKGEWLTLYSSGNINFGTTSITSLNGTMTLNSSIVDISNSDKNAKLYLNGKEFSGGSAVWG